MISPFSFQGELTRAPYALLAGGAFLTQHVVALACMAAFAQTSAAHLWFAFNPLRFMLEGAPPWAPLFAISLAIIVDWALVALSFRRARNAGISPALATLMVVPGFQVGALAFLAIAPTKKPDAALTPPHEVEIRSRAQQITMGLLIGVAICVGAVALSALVFGSYGYALFMATPFVVGMTAAFIANWKDNIGFGATQSTVFGALGLGSLALLLFALEGVICLVFAAPLIAAMGFIGGLLGQAAARLKTRRRASSAALAVALLPMMLAAEMLAPPQARFESIESIEIAAPPDAVWRAITDMGRIEEAPAPPFSWGLAYPIDGEINGAGVGAVRRGVFSTGVAYEQVTHWEPGRKLSFEVTSNPPMMREISPYSQIHAPHTNGYFRTEDVDFLIEPLDGETTRLILATRHTLDIEPAAYWTPLAQWTVHANKRRVLNHFRNRAESLSNAAQE